MNKFSTCASVHGTNAEVCQVPEFLCDVLQLVDYLQTFIFECALLAGSYSALTQGVLCVCGF